MNAASEIPLTNNVSSSSLAANKIDNYGKSWSLVGSFELFRGLRQMSITMRVISGVSFLWLPILVTIYCHAMPLYHAIYAIRNKDIFAAKRILKYWLLIHVFLALDIPLLLFIAKMFSPKTHSGVVEYNIAAETKLVVALALSFADFKIPEYIYKHIISPIFAMFELELVRFVKGVYVAISSYILRNARNILWSLLLSNDGLVPYDSIVKYFSPPTNADRTPITFSGSSSSSINKETTQNMSLGQRILLESRRILLSGVLLQVTFTNLFDIPSSQYSSPTKPTSADLKANRRLSRNVIHERLYSDRFSMMMLNRSNEFYMRIKSVHVNSNNINSSSGSGSCSDSNSSNNNSINSNSSNSNNNVHTFDILLALINIKSVSISGFDDTSKELSVELYSPVKLFPIQNCTSSDAPSPLQTDSDDSLNHKLVAYITFSSFKVSLASIEDCDCFIAGIQAINCAAKKKISSKLARGLSTLEMVRDRAFNKLENIQDDLSSSSSGPGTSAVAVLKHYWDKWRGVKT